MFITRFAIVGLVAAVLASTVAIVRDAGDDRPVADAAPGILLDDSSGIAPLGEVVEFFERRVENRPDDHVAQTNLARSLGELAAQTADIGLYREAETAARAALEIAPGSRPAALALASALQAQHRFDEALAISTDVLDQAPSSTAALTAVADAYFELGDLDRAGDAFRRLDAAGSNAATLSRLARLASERGDHDESIELAERAEAASASFSLRPNQAAFYPFQTGHFRVHGGDVDGAMESLEAALDIDPDHPGATELLASLLAATGDFDGSAALFERRLGLGPAAGIHASYAVVLRALGRDDAAAEHEQLARELAAVTDDPTEHGHLSQFPLDLSSSGPVAAAPGESAES
ncbi:MAG: tetratricopeptide repeat protein [Actinomycetota bacterium]